MEMKCFLCGKEARKKITGQFLFNSKVIGRVEVPGIEYTECQSCGEKRISLEMSKKVSAYVQEKERDAIGSLPIDNFITADEAAELLKISKQAFSKHSAIKRGLLYSVEKGKRKFYDRASVLRFKINKKDGRYLIKESQLTELNADMNIYLIKSPQVTKLGHSTVWLKKGIGWTDLDCDFEITQDIPLLSSTSPCSIMH
jgi:hypothetical protein